MTDASARYWVKTWADYLHWKRNPTIPLLAIMFVCFEFQDTWISDSRHARNQSSSHNQLLSCIPLMSSSSRVFCFAEAEACICRMRSSSMRMTLSAANLVFSKTDCLGDEWPHWGSAWWLDTSWHCFLWAPALCWAETIGALCFANVTVAIPIFCQLRPHLIEMFQLQTPYVQVCISAVRCWPNPTPSVAYCSGHLGREFKWALKGPTAPSAAWQRGIKLVFTSRLYCPPCLGASKCIKDGYSVHWQIYPERKWQQGTDHRSTQQHLTKNISCAANRSWRRTPKTRTSNLTGGTSTLQNRFRKPGWKQIFPKSIPNSQKQKQLPNTQWVKYVYCLALLTLEVGRARRNHSTNTLWKKRFSKSVCNTVANIPEARAKGFFPKNCCPPSLFTSST